MSTLTGSQHERLYRPLGRSLSDPPRLRAHKPLPRRRDATDTFYHTALPVTLAFHADDDKSPLHSAQNTTSPHASPPSVSHAQDSGMPPTPPSRDSQENVPPSERTPPPFADGIPGAFLSNKSSLATPINQRSPPTPDPSPPGTSDSVSTLQRPSASVSVQYNSSRAESFKTAREELSSVADTQSERWIGDTPAMSQFSSPVPPASADEHRLSFDFETSQADGRRAAERPALFRHAPGSDRASDARPANDARDEQFQNFNHIPDREWDTNLMRNVSVRRNRRPATPPKQTRSDDDPPASPSLKRDFSMRKRLQRDGEPHQSPSISQASPTSDWPSEVSSRLRDHLQGDDSRRYSSGSFSSTVVEAVVVITPERRRRSLRHAGKNLAYRAVSEGSSTLSVRSRSTRLSNYSDDSPSRRLHHQTAKIPERRNRDSIGSDFSVEPSASTVAAPQQIKETIPVLIVQKQRTPTLQPAAEITSKQRSVSTPERSQSLRQPPKRREIDPSVSTPDRSQSLRQPSRNREVDPYVSTPDRSQSLRQTPKNRGVDPSVSTPDRSQSLRQTPRKYEIDPHETPKQRPHSQGNAVTALLPEINVVESTPRRPVQLEASPGRPRPDSQTLGQPRTFAAILMEQTSQPGPSAAVPIAPPAALMEDKHAKPDPRNDADRTPVQNPARNTSDSLGQASQNSQTPRQEAYAPKPRTMSGSTDRRRPSLAPTEELPRFGLDDDHRRLSIDRATIRTEEQTLSRHLWTPGTPFSQFSRTPDALEVREATAISIFPHNNHSLLIVQHVAPERSHIISRQVTVDVSSEPAPPQVLQQPILTFEPSTPPQTGMAPASAAVDSPLRNPRKPPVPPAFKIIPPTPAEELDRQLAANNSDDANTPRRRLSLRQRARRYSDNILAPVLARWPSGSGRRSASNPPNGRRAGDRPEKEGKLHPFWRPRNFWDSDDETESDSDSEFGDFEADRLPEGGDTSDVMPPEERRNSIAELGRRLSNGFKGSGGFLIGHSLGLDRGPSNKRRHHVSLPPRLRDRRALVQASAVAQGKRSGRLFGPRDNIPIITTTSPPPPGSGRSSGRASPVLGTSHRVNKNRASPPPAVNHQFLSPYPRSSYASNNTNTNSASGSGSGSGYGSGSGSGSGGSNASLYSLQNNSIDVSAQATGALQRRGTIRRVRSGLRRAHRVPGLGIEVQYVGIRGMRERWAEKRAEKRRKELRERIGARWVVEGQGVV